MVFLKDKVIRIDESVVEEMKYNAGKNLLGKFRYCFHENENAGMQEMLFVISNTGYARPHMHKNAAESQIVISGEGYCILFDMLGDIIETFKVSPKDNFIYRIQKEIWHMLLPISEQMVIYEVREGIFNSNTNIYPQWAPKEDEIEQVRQYKQKLLNRVKGGTE